MARARNIKPSFFKNEILGVEDPLISLLFISLWCLADKDGKLEDRPLRIKAETFPYRENIDINGYLTVLVQHGFIRRYSADGVAVIQVIKFKEHQSPHNTEKASNLPDFDPNYTENKEQKDLTVNSPLCLREETESKRPDSLIPDSLIPDSLIPDSLIPDTGTSGSIEPSVPNFPDGVSEKPSPRPEKKSQSQKNQTAPTSETWTAYSDAYETRYGAKPVRNATISGQLAQFVKRIGSEEAPHVAEFFVHHNNQFYVTKMHTVGLLLADAEKLRTEWVTRRTMTATQARQADKKQSTANIFNKLIDEQRSLAHVKS